MNGNKQGADFMKIGSFSGRRMEGRAADWDTTELASHQGYVSGIYTEFLESNS